MDGIARKAILPTRWKSRNHPGCQGHAPGDRRSGGDKRPFRRQRHHVDYRNAEAPPDQLVRARARQSARLGCLMSSTQAPRKRLLDAGVSFATNANVAEYLGPGEVEIIQ